MITIDIDDDGLVIHVPHRDALAFSALIEDGQRQQRLSPAETDFRQRVLAAIMQAIAELARAGRPRPGGRAG